MAIDPSTGKEIRKKKFTKRQVREALVKFGGVKVHAAKALGCDRKTLEAYVQRYPDLKDLRESLIEGHVDEIEKKVFQSGKKGDMRAALFVLRTLGRKRGYVEGKPQATGDVVHTESQKILMKLREGAISPTEAALDFDILGQPIPDSVRILLGKEVPEPVDPTAGQYSVVTDEELRRRLEERAKAIQEQKGDFLGERRAQVNELREQAKDSFGVHGGVMDEGADEGVDHG